MKLSISNIAWKEERDREVYALMEQYGFSGLEIAPTRIIRENPYDKPTEIKNWLADLNREYAFVIPSMQSIWFGRQENLFGSEEERNALLAYTKKAVGFAEAAGCKNLVFGCPRNRNVQEGADVKTAVSFFKELGEYAERKGTAIGMEANPPIYNTNYINDTASAIELVKTVNSDGFKLNLDLGTMIYYQEDIAMLEGAVPLISHVHISEPGLAPIEERKLHRELSALLKRENYNGYVSIEMGKQEELSVIEKTFAYVKEIFYDI